MSIVASGITVDSYVYDKDGNLVSTDDLTPEQKKRLGTFILTTFVSGCYPGNVHFHTEEEASENPTGNLDSAA